jgi:hypothetical protein
VIDGLFSEPFNIFDEVIVQRLHISQIRIGLFQKRSLKLIKQPLPPSRRNLALTLPAIEEDGLLGGIEDHPAVLASRQMLLGFESQRLVQIAVDIV